MTGDPVRRRCRRFRELQRQRGLKGVAARARLREERPEKAVCVGTVTFEGPAFGGRHVMRCLAADWFDEQRLMVEIDGAAFAPRTVRGLWRLVTKRVMRTGKDGRG